MYLNYKSIIHKYWDLAILGLFLFLWGVLIIFEFAFDLSLRTIPRNVFTWLSASAMIIFFAWLSIRIHRMAQQNKPAWIRMAARCVPPASIALSLTLIMVTAMVSILSYRPEHVIEKNGYTMVARVHSFLDESVYYYLYKGPIFYGQNMGYEYYGSGGNDPLSQTPAPEPKRWCFYDLDGHVIENGPATENEATAEMEPTIDTKKLDVTVIENRENELVFDISMADFIESYNSLYLMDKGKEYLRSEAQWRMLTCDNAIHSNHETALFEFSQDERIWSKPTITVYVPTNGDYVQEVTINFDKHGYSKAFYSEFEEQCFYTLKAFFPELEDESIIALYEEVNALGDQNVFQMEDGYRKGCIPCAIFHKDGVGVYPYFAIGERVHLCIIPVTQEIIDDYRQKGVEIREIE